VPARLTNTTRRCQAFAALATLLFGTAGAAAPQRPDAPVTARECVAEARTPAAMAACEREAQVALKARIEQLSDAIRARLDARQRLVFERSAEAWQTFVGREQGMLELSLGRRGDGLGPTLLPGAVSELYETRERQLREHLHNLNLARPPAVDKP